MGKQLARALNDYFSRGVSTGAMAMSLVTMISLENVIPEYVKEEKLTEIYKSIEEDMSRVWDETVSKAHTEKQYNDAADLLIGHCEEIRKRRNLEALE